jgi:hypothetical protein
MGSLNTESTLQPEHFSPHSGSPGLAKMQEFHSASLEMRF